MNPAIKVIKPSGILDGSSGLELRRTIDDMLRAGGRIILIDCTAIEFMDSAGLGALVVVLKQIRASGGWMSLCGINDQVKMLLELTNMKQVFEIFATAEVFNQTV
jgi:anti-anti-sigma factor